MMGKIITEKEYDRRTLEQPMEHWIGKYFRPSDMHKAKRLKTVTDALSPEKGERILDVGCGYGTFILRSRDRKAKCFGIDYSKETLRMGRRIFEKISPQTERNVFVHASATRLPFKQDSFDKLLNVDFLEHVYEKEKDSVAAEMARVLKKGGIAVSYTPNRKRMRFDYFLKKFFLGLQGKRLGWQYSDEKTVLFDTDLHVGLSTASELKRLFERHGLRIKKAGFVECSFPLLSRVFPGFSIMPDVFGAYILLVAEKQ